MCVYTDKSDCSGEIHSLNIEETLNENQPSPTERYECREGASEEQTVWCHAFTHTDHIHHKDYYVVSEPKSYLDVCLFFIEFVPQDLIMYLYDILSHSANVLSKVTANKEGLITLHTGSLLFIAIYSSLTKCVMISF